jgi:very-short-patch-repair endonuclease
MQSTGDKARNLRSNQTDTERKLWTYLRASRFKDFKFRRQHPIGPFIADFCCPSRRLVIELDGGQHGDDSGRDRRRTLFLEAQGYRVIRFWDNELNDIRIGTHGNS